MTIDPEGSRRIRLDREAAEKARPACEVLDSAERKDLVVERDATLDLEPEGDHAHHFHAVSLGSFDDLRALRLVPDMEEGAVREAMQRDDAEALEIARDLVRHGKAPGAGGCSCGGGHAHRIEADTADRAHHALETPAQAEAPASFGAELRRAYDYVRASHHPSLAAAIREGTGRQLRPDDRGLRAVGRWMELHKWATLLIPVVHDITIGHNATLNVGSSSTSMWANDVRIHSGGRMVIKSSYMKVTCASVQGDIP